MAKNSGTDPTKGPLGGVFAFLGGMVGALYGAAIGNLITAAIGFFVGVWAGYVLEHLVYRLIILAMVVIFIFARQAFFHAIFESALLQTPDQPRAPYVQVKEQDCA